MKEKCICGEPGEWREGGKYLLCDIHYNPSIKVDNPKEGTVGITSGPQKTAQRPDLNFGLKIIPGPLHNGELQEAIDAVLDHQQHERVAKHLDLLLREQAIRIKGYIELKEPTSD